MAGPKNGIATVIPVDVNDVPLGSTANPMVGANAPYPSGSTAITATSGNVAAASAVATLAKVAAKTTYISGFQVTGAGATSGLPVTVTVVGVITGTLSFTYTAVAGVLLANQPLIVKFDPPIPSSAVNTDIVVTCPTLGTGNTNNTVNAQGFLL